MCPPRPSTDPRSLLIFIIITWSWIAFQNGAHCSAPTFSEEYRQDEVDLHVDLLQETLGTLPCSSFRSFYSTYLVGVAPVDELECMNSRGEAFSAGDDGTAVIGDVCELSCAEGFNLAVQNSGPSVYTCNWQLGDTLTELTAWTGSALCVSDCTLCLRINQEVCGVNGQNYASPCSADCEGIAIAYTGACDECRSACPLDDKSACGFNGVTYLNSCFARCDDTTILHLGECNDPAPTPTQAATPIPTQAETSGMCPPLPPSPNASVDQTTTCVAAAEGDVCRHACDENTVQSGGSGYFICQSDGTWYPDPSDVPPIQCQPFCPPFPPAIHNYSSTSCSVFPGSECVLACANGYSRVSNTEEHAVCSETGAWLTPAGVAITTDNILQCDPKTCITTIGFKIEFFACEFDEGSNTYEERVPYEVDQEMVIEAENGTLTRIPLIAGRNTFTTVFDGREYLFVTIMEEPSSEAHLEALTLYNFNTNEAFQNDTYDYYSTLPLWVDEVTVDPTAAKFAEASVLLSPGCNTNNDAQTTRPYTLSIQETPVTIYVCVMAQDGISFAEYTIALERDVPNTCTDQRICEAQESGSCGNFCGDEETLTIGIVVPLGLGGTLFALWLVTVLILRRAFPSYGWLSSETLTFFSTLFDVGSDVCFVLVLVSTDFATLTIVAIMCVAVNVVINGVIIVYVAQRERRGNASFAEWIRERYLVAAVFSFFSLGNCEAFLIIRAGFTATEKSAATTTSHANLASTDTGSSARILASKSSFVVPWFSAPLSHSSMRTLQNFSWISLVVDDIGLFIVQLLVYRMEIGILQIGGVLFVLAAIKLMTLALRAVIFGCRTYMTRPTGKNDFAKTVTVADIELQKKSDPNAGSYGHFERERKLSQSQHTARSEDGINGSDPSRRNPEQPVRIGSGSSDRKPFGQSLPLPRNPPRATNPSVSRDSAHSSRLAAPDEKLQPPGSAVYNHLIDVFERAKVDADKRIRPAPPRPPARSTSNEVTRAHSQASPAAAPQLSPRDQHQVRQPSTAAGMHASRVPPRVSPTSHQGRHSFAAVQAQLAPALPHMPQNFRPGSKS